MARLRSPARAEGWTPRNRLHVSSRLSISMRSALANAMLVANFAALIGTFVSNVHVFFGKGGLADLRTLTKGALAWDAPTRRSRTNVLGRIRAVLMDEPFGALDAQTKLQLWMCCLIYGARNDGPCCLLPTTERGGHSL